MQSLMEKKQLTPEIAKDIFALFDEDHTEQVEFGEFVDLSFYVNELEYLISFHYLLFIFLLAFLFHLSILLSLSFPPLLSSFLPSFISLLSFIPFPFLFYLTPQVSI